MFHTVKVLISKDDAGNTFAGIQRYDNHGKLGYTAVRCGQGKLYCTSPERAINALYAARFHFMHVEGNTRVYGKFIA